jgi:putative Holliday junction resolvase
MGFVPSLAVDFGARRVGVAVSESDVLATPHSVIRNDGDVDRVVERVARIASEVEAATIVLGIPRTRGAGAARTEARYAALAEKLRQRTRKDVILWDESLTTVEAAEKLREAGRPDTAIDMYAAAVILQSWLDAQRGRQP